MRILFAHGDKTEMSKYLQALGKYGSVDFFDNGRDAVDSFVNGFQTGNHYDLLVIDYDLKQLDGVETVLMIRKYESEHMASNKKSLIVFSSEDHHCKGLYEARHRVDERIVFQSSPLNLSIVECIAERIDDDRYKDILPGLARYRRQLNMFV